jgi:hypothetical protein
MRRTKVRLAATGIEVLDVELARIDPAADPRSFVRKTERFAQLCELARPLGLTIDLEIPRGRRLGISPRPR